MGRNRAWTVEEKNYLESSWGRVTLPTIAKKLGRTELAIKLKASRMNLGGYIKNTDMISLKQLLLLLGYKDISRGVRAHVIKAGLPIKKVRAKKVLVSMVSIPKFWEWANSHRDFFRYDLLEPLILGMEPSWVAQQRHIDYQCKYPRRRWSSTDDSLLEYMVRKGECAHSISERLNRSERAVMSRCWYLGIDSPKPKGKLARWSEAENEKLREFWRVRYPVKYIALKMGRSEIAIEARIAKLKLKEAANG